MRHIGLLLLLLLVVGGVMAQDPTQPPPPTPTLAPVLVPTETATPLPTPTALPNVAALNASGDAVAQIHLNARNDLEILANATIGTINRPAGWSGSYDVASPEMALRLRLDLEILTDQLLPNVRPDGWFGVQTSTSYALARDIRHDLELLADTVIAPSVRPPNWLGDDPMMRCDRSTQTLVELLVSRNLFMPTSSPASPTYCTDLSNEVTVFTEINLLDRSAAPPSDESNNDNTNTNDNAPAVPNNVTVIGADAVAYYDRSAQQRAGIIPDGTIIEPIARSYAQFSRMTLVRGEDFVLFVDYQNTTLDSTAFEQLGDVNVIDYQTTCQPEWCGIAN